MLLNELLKVIQFFPMTCYGNFLTYMPHLIYKFTTSVCDGARVRHRRTTGPGPAKTGEGLTGCDGGQHGRAGHGRVPAGTRALCHGWTGTGPLCFRGCRRHRPGYPSSVVSLLSLCSSRREGAGTSRLRLTVSEGHGYPLVILVTRNFEELVYGKFCIIFLYGFLSTIPKKILKTTTSLPSLTTSTLS
jgi:hypothetical protein